MCSLSWCHSKDGYKVFFNRDEKKTRGRAAPPALGENHSVRYLAPRDADAGGTWLLANEHGVTLALLNYWSTSAKEMSAPMSRGRLLRDVLAAQTSASEAVKHAQSMNLEGYGSFTLAAFDLVQHEGPLVLRWDGESFSLLPPNLPLCSSSFLPDAVIEFRQRSFKTLRDHEPDTLWNWHRHELAPTAYTVRMNRPDAQTWSISRVTVSRAAIRWLYVEEMPGLTTYPCEHEVLLKL